MTGIDAPKGTHDILPRDQPLWRFVTGTMERLCAQYGYHPIQTPVFEDTELFARTSGAGSDVVQKEMYTFADRGDRSLTLRPEGTAPICRAYIEHGMHREPQPVKMYTIAPMYRYSAPQRGRYREHWQLSLEAIGSADPAVDAEVLEFYRTLLEELGVKTFELQLNSIGDAGCRPAYLEKLNAWLDANADALDDEARQKRETSPLRVFDVKNPAVRAALDDAPKIGDSLCAECEAHFAEVRRYLDAYGVSYVIDPTLVRGLDYYTRTTWEFVGPDESGQAGTLSGGGRYDGLIEEIGGPATPGIGFGAGHRAADPGARARRSNRRGAGHRRLHDGGRDRRPRRRSGRAGEAAARRAALRHRLRGALREGPDDPGGPPRRADRRARHGRNGHTEERRRRSRRADPDPANCGRGSGHPSPPPALNANEKRRACLARFEPKLERN